MPLTEQHLADLASRSYERNYNTYSEFLSLDEISTLYTLRLPVKFRLFGGYDGAERCVACFGDNGDRLCYPIKCLRLSPLNQKFADKLSHRDFLGALMNLGINRNVLGDIIVKDNEGYLFCLDSISGYICDNLTRIRHTTVMCEELSTAEDFTPEEPEEAEITAASARVDAVCAAVYKLSRSNMAELFKSRKVFINSRLCGKEGAALKDGDRVSVRGYGKFIFGSEIRSTKKGRLVISVKIYR